MPYIDPLKVNSPKSRWGENHVVLIDTGSGGWSAAQGTWDDEPCLGLRWNGIVGEDSIGNPQSRGNPTWWIVPNELVDVILRQIELVKMAQGLVSCEITKPDEYDVGAWRVKAVLSKQVKNNLGDHQVSFKLPEIENRLCHPERGYLQVDKDGISGVFIDGVWYGDLYSNGIAEKDNPVTLEMYKQAFVQSVTKAISISGVMALKT